MFAVGLHRALAVTKLWSSAASCKKFVVNLNNGDNPS